MSTDASNEAQNGDGKRKRQAHSTEGVPSKPRNAFDELMTQIKKPKKSTDQFRPPSSYHSSFRDILNQYIIRPEKFGPKVVIRHNEKFVVLNDAYPKASLHLLVMPRDMEKTKLHPVTALKDKEFFKEVYEEVLNVKELAAKELKRRHGGERDWTKEINAGIHANPSMNNIHIHVISRDMAGPALKKRIHYNSFTTPFFIPLEKFLEEDPELETPKAYGEYLSRPMQCWRCGKNFDNKFAELKRHLAIEFERWKKEQPPAGKLEEVVTDPVDKGEEDIAEGDGDSASGNELQEAE